MLFTTSRVIVSMLVQRENEFLFIRQNKSGGAYPGTLHIPGGGLEAGESPLDGAIREVREEVGLELSPNNVAKVDFSWDTVTYKGEPTLLIFLRFLGTSEDGLAVAAGDASEVLWLKRQDLARAPHNPATLDLLKTLNLI